MNAQAVNRVINSRGLTVVAFVILAVCASFALFSDKFAHIDSDNGLIAVNDLQPAVSPIVSLIFNIAVNLLVVAMMLYINKFYNIPRTITSLYATMFLVIQTSQPAVTVQFYLGSFLVVVMLAVMLLMFGTYSRLNMMRRIFLIFFMLSAASAVQYAFALYLPVMFIGCAQIRVMSLRTIIAAILGIISPWWILMGFGLVTPDMFVLPHFTSIFASIHIHDRILLWFSALLTILLGITAYCLVLFKLMTYNAGTRAYNGLLTLITFVTMLFVIVDFNNSLVYLPLLNACVAFQLSQLFFIKNSSRIWITVVIVILIYYSTYAARFIL